MLSKRNNTPGYRVFGISEFWKNSTSFSLQGLTLHSAATTKAGHAESQILGYRDCRNAALLQLRLIFNFFSYTVILIGGFATK